MFTFSDSLSNIKLVGGENNLDNTCDKIQGGFPRIIICDQEFIQKINSRKPREFSNKDVLTIKEIIQSKKTEPLFDILSDTNNINIDDMNGGNIDKKKKINGVSIESIIGKK